jgi:hypothetical protein
MGKMWIRFLVMLLAALALAACHKSHQDQLTEATDTPQQAVETAVDDFKAGHFDALLEHSLPPEDYKSLRANWAQKRQHALDEVSAADRKRFATRMHELTEPGAKQKEFDKLKPVLDAWQKKYKDRLPMMVGVFRIMAGTKITQSKTLSPKQKRQARGVLDALAQWAEKTDWGDKDKAKQAVGIVVDTARALKIKTLEEANKLSYKEAMQRYATAWKGLRQLLAVYGLSLDDIMDSAKVKTVRKDGDTATVQVDYTILDKPMTSTIAMRRQGKRWYMRDFVRYWHHHQGAQALATRAAPAARAASTGAPASPMTAAPSSSAPMPARATTR